MQSLLLGLVGLGSFIGLWHGLAVSGLILDVFLPSPVEVYDRFTTLLDRRFAGATL
ncbi:MAG: ABC transporter permease, partial [Roseinatronobacter sp.]